MGHCDYESVSLSVEVYMSQLRAAVPHRNHMSELPVSSVNSDVTALGAAWAWRRSEAPWVTAVCSQG